MPANVKSFEFIVSHADVPAYVVTVVPVLESPLI